MSKKKNPADLEKVGQKPFYETPDEMQEKIEEYFEYIKGEFHFETRETENFEEIKVVVWDRHPEPALITGLTLFLGFCDRQSLYDYQNNKPEFTAIVKRARLRVEMAYEFRLAEDKPVGAIFALKNMGWKDKQETEITGNGINLTIVRGNRNDPAGTSSGAN